MLPVYRYHDSVRLARILGNEVPLFLLDSCQIFTPLFYPSSSRRHRGESGIAKSVMVRQESKFPQRFTGLRICGSLVGCNLVAMDDLIARSRFFIRLIREEYFEN